MKNTNRVAIIGSLALMIFLLCFGGGCGGSGDSVGSISIYNLSPTSITLIHNSGTTIVNLTFNAAGFSGYPTASFVLINSSGLGLQAPQFVLITNPSGSIAVAFSIDTTNLAAGSSGFFQVGLTDDTGAISNTLGGTWIAT
jgi:hypothetical protein